MKNQCVAETTSGNRCMNSVWNGSNTFCYSHTSMKNVKIFPIDLDNYSRPIRTTPPQLKEKHYKYCHSKNTAEDCDKNICMWKWNECNRGFGTKKVKRTIEHFSL